MAVSTRFRPQSRDTLFVSELFDSLQGEGPHTGQPAAFLRLMGCNLKCSWCDTAYTWDHKRFKLAEERRPLSTAQVFKMLADLHSPRLVITGGEPLLQAPALGPLLYRLGRETAMQVEVETNGTLPPPSTWMFMVAQWNVSPKLPHSGNDPKKAWNESMLRTWAQIQAAVFKFVCKTPEDVALVAKATTPLGITPNRVWIMPEGVTAPVQIHRTRRLVPAALAHDFNFSPRLHILAYGDERGR
jgi:7-carboxy-7-deazaguanine synthase